MADCSRQLNLALEARYCSLIQLALLGREIQFHDAFFPVLAFAKQGCAIAALTERLNDGQELATGPYTVCFDLLDYTISIHNHLVPTKLV